MPDPVPVVEPKKKEKRASKGLVDFGVEKSRTSRAAKEALPSVPCTIDSKLRAANSILQRDMADDELSARPGSQSYIGWRICQ